MKKLCLILALLLVFCACGKEPEPAVPPEDPENPISENSESEPAFEEPEKIAQTEIIISDSKNDYSGYLDFEIPAFPDADMSELSLNGAETEKWCINGESYIQQNPWEQVFVKDETASELAVAIALAEANVTYSHHPDGYNDFSDISEANNQFLLYAAIKSTPQLGYYGAHENNIVYNIYNYCKNELDLLPTEIYSAKDIEKTFRYLFGDEIDFVPESINYRGYRYIPEADIFIWFLETAVPDYTYPQVLSYYAEDGKYFVKAVHTGIYDYKNGKVLPEIEIEDFKLNPCFDYIFEKTEDGHFVLLSIKRAE